MQAVHAIAHVGANVTPLARRRDVDDTAAATVPFVAAAPAAAASQRTHAEAPAALAAPLGHAWHAVLARNAENLPAAHATHAAPEIMVPGAQLLHTVTVAPPAEKVSGAGQATHTLAALLYCPPAHTAASAGRQ